MTGKGNTTSVMIPDQKEWAELSYKASMLGINLSELFWEGAKAYKPKKGIPKGMELFMDLCDIPKDFYNKKQWKKYSDKIGKNKKLDEMIFWLAGLRGI